MHTFSLLHFLVMTNLSPDKIAGIDEHLLLLTIPKDTGVCICTATLIKQEKEEKLRKQNDFVVEKERNHNAFCH